MKTLRVGAAFPDPPSNGMPDDTALDIDLMTEIAKALGVTVEFVPYEGADSSSLDNRSPSTPDGCHKSGPSMTSKA
jgi:polar amino acid transport system substrate-binding protein